MKTQERLYNFYFLKYFKVIKLKKLDHSQRNNVIIVSRKSEIKVKKHNISLISFLQGYTYIYQNTKIVGVNVYTTYLRKQKVWGDKCF